MAFSDAAVTCVLPVAADSQIPGTDALTGAPAVPNALERVVKQLDTLKLRTSRPEFDIPSGIVMVPMDLKSGRRGLGPAAI